MVTRAKDRKALKRHLQGQWHDFKLNSQKCSLGDHLPKLLKPFRYDEQDDCQS